MDRQQEIAEVLSQQMYANNQTQEFVKPSAQIQLQSQPEN